MLNKYNISKIASNSMPVILSSIDATVLKQFLNFTNLPLVQVIQNTTGLDFNDVATYAHGVKPTLDVLLFYPDMDLYSTVDLTS